MSDSGLPHDEESDGVVESLLEAIPDDADEANKQRWIAQARLGDAAREVLNRKWPGWEDK